MSHTVYDFKLPPEEEVIQRNRTITACYAKLYQLQPHLYKWAGMAAFASFHIGEKMKMWNWQASGIKSFSITCKKRNRSWEDDVQIIRIINNRIFAEIGWVHLAFAQMDFRSFHSLLLEKGKHQLIIAAFSQLNEARTQLKQSNDSPLINDLIWKANTEILWHEQAMVVQPLFDRLSDSFSWAMTLFASFDYKINHRKTGWQTSSRFIVYLLLNGFKLIKKNGFLPELTNLEHRWYWIVNDVLKRWKTVEADKALIYAEIGLLTEMENNDLIP